MRELDDRNSQDEHVKAKICKCCECPKRVSITRTAINDLGIIPLTKDSVLAAAREHIQLKRRVYTDKMDSGETAYIIKECKVEETLLYVKVKFFRRGTGESMLIMSAHPPRRW